MIIRKSAREIDLMAAAGEVVAETLAVVEERLDLLAELGLLGNCCPEHVAGRDVRYRVVDCDPLCLCPLAGALRTQDEQEAVARMAKRAQEEGRTDDTPEAIRTRLANYRENTAPLIEWYRARDKVVPVNGLGTIDEVFAQIRKALDHMGARA